MPLQVVQSESEEIEDGSVAHAPVALAFDVLITADVINVELQTNAVKIILESFKFNAEWT